MIQNPVDISSQSGHVTLAAFISFTFAAWPWANESANMSSSGKVLAGPEARGYARLFVTDSARRATVKLSYTTVEGREGVGRKCVCGEPLQLLLLLLHRHPSTRLLHTARPPSSIRPKSQLTDRIICGGKRGK